MLKDAGRKILINRISDAIMLKLTIAAPFFAFPVVRQITSFIVSKVVTQVFTFGEEWGIVIKVDYVEEKKQDRYDEAVVVFEETISNTEATKEELQKAEDEFDETLRDLIRISTD